MPRRWLWRAPSLILLIAVMGFGEAAVAILGGDAGGTGALYFVARGWIRGGM